LLARLASTPLTNSAWDDGVLPHLITDGAVQNARTQALFASLASAIAAGAPSDSVAPTEFDAELSPDGQVRILTPA
jgi:hypothetical protein